MRLISSKFHEENASYLQEILQGKMCHIRSKFNVEKFVHVSSKFYKQKSDL